MERERDDDERQREGERESAGASAAPVSQEKADDSRLILTGHGPKWLFICRASLQLRKEQLSLAVQLKWKNPWGFSNKCKSL